MYDGQSSTVGQFSEFVPPAESTEVEVADEDGDVGDTDGDDTSQFEGEADGIEQHGSGEDDDTDGSDDGAVGGVEITTDRTIPTSAGGIIDQLFSVDQSLLSSKTYSLRYWTAVIMARWGKMNEERIQEKFGIPRSTIRSHLDKNPRACHYIAPTKIKYVATTADEIVDHLSKPDDTIEVTRETYSLRFWLSIVLRRFQKMNRGHNKLAELSAISKWKVKNGAKNGLTPASQHFIAAVDTSLEN